VARFRLTAPHWLEVSGVAQLIEAGAEIDTAELPDHFQPTPEMRALDGAALAALAEVCQHIRRTAADVNIPGFGHVDTWSRAEE
jgi:hypothetical protein